MQNDLAAERADVVVKFIGLARYASLPTKLLPGIGTHAVPVDTAIYARCVVRDALMERGYLSASWPDNSAYAAAGDIVQYLIDAGLLVAQIAAEPSKAGPDDVATPLNCGCGHPKTPFGTDTSWMCDYHRAFAERTNAHFDRENN